MQNGAKPPMQGNSYMLKKIQCSVNGMTSSSCTCTLYRYSAWDVRELQQMFLSKIVIKLRTSPAEIEDDINTVSEWPDNDSSHQGLLNYRKGEQLKTRFLSAYNV